MEEEEEKLEQSEQKETEIKEKPLINHARQN
jgi:hypothetical protein